MALQHLRSSTADKRPTPGAMSDGQLAMNTQTDSPGLFFKDSNGDLVKVGPVHVGATAPNASPAAGGQSGNSTGEQWLDTSGTNPVLKIWDGSAWQSEAGEFVNVSGDTMTGALVMDNQQQVRFRETTANGTNYIALQAPASVASDKTITLPDVTGTVVTTGDTGSVTSTMILDGTIVNGDINASAAIAGTKISPDFGSQNIVTTGDLTVDTNTLYVDSTNNRVGLGTSSPQRPFDVVSNSSAETATFRGRSSDNIGTIRFSSNDAGTNYASIQSRPAYFEIGTSSSIPLVLAPGSGTGVGIGTTSPGSVLTVEQSTGNINLELHSTSSGRGTQTKTHNDHATFYHGLAGDTSGNYIYYTADSKEHVFSTANSEAVRIDSSQRLLVGTSTAPPIPNGQSIYVSGTGSTSSGIQCVRWNASFGGYALGIGRSRSGTPGSYSSVSSGDDLGSIIWYGDDGSDLNSQAAAINAYVDGTPGSNDMPGRLVFSTTADGAASPTQRMIIRQDGTTQIFAVYTATTGAAANVNVDVNGYLTRSTSSIKYKTSVETLEDQYADALLQCRPVWYRSLSEKDNPEWGWWGFIAEEVAEIDPRLVHWKTQEVTFDETGSAVTTDLEAPEPEGVQYDRFVPHLLNLIKRQKEQIEAMEARLSALEAQ